MKITLSTHDLAHALQADSNANWSYAGARALALYLEDLDSQLDEETEFDACAIRCEFSEYESLSDWAEDYGYTGSIEDDEISDYILDRGTLIAFKGGIIVSNF